MHVSNSGAVVVCAVDFTDGELVRHDGVWHAQVGKELKVHEPHQGSVEFHKGAHNFVVHIERQSLVELVGGHPSDLLSHNLNTVVDTFDGEERLGDALGDRAVQKEVFVEVTALLQILGLDFEGQVLGELCEKRDQTERVVQIGKSIHKCWVAVLNNGGQ